MNAVTLPRVLPLIEDEQNLAADAALIDSLPSLSEGMQARVLDLLARRGQAEPLAGMVARLNTAPPTLQRLIVERAGALEGGVRVAIAGDDMDTRLAAIELIERSGDCRLAYLLSGAIRASCPRTRGRAAGAIHLMTTQLLDRDQTAAGVRANMEARKHLATALVEVVRSWESHLQPKALEAALFLPDEVFTAVAAKLDEGRSHITQALTLLLEGTTDWRLAGFALRSMAIAPLRKAAAGAIQRATEPAFVRALARHGHLIADAEVRKGCAWIRELRCLEHGLSILDKLSIAESVALIWLVGATGLSPKRKSDIFREALTLTDPQVHQAVIHQLIADQADWSTELLSIVASRGGEAGALASRGLTDRGVAGGESPATPPAAAELRPTATSPRPREATPTPQQLWTRLWHEFDGLPSADAYAAATELSTLGLDLPAAVRAKLASSQPIDRARALRVVRTMKLVALLEEEVYRHTSDPDPVVRSAAVGVLADLPGATSERILRRAVNDPDHRVQANAIEVLDALGSPERRRLVEPKLDSTSGRVRANAVKALLRLELRQAGEALLDMLDHPARGQRLSALWVVERLHLESVLHRIADLSRSDEDERVRHRAARVLSALTRGLGDAALVPADADHKPEARP
jgi:hypothetical protein